MNYSGSAIRKGWGPIQRSHYKPRYATSNLFSDISEELGTPITEAHANFKVLNNLKPMPPKRFEHPEETNDSKPKPKQRRKYGGARNSVTIMGYTISKKHASIAWYTLLFLFVLCLSVLSVFVVCGKK